ncbi:hypothetical protein COBT_003918, partial [Conglomerata obtusa]
ILKASDQIDMLDTAKKDLIKSYAVFYDSFVYFLNDIDQQYHSFDTFILKLGNADLAKINVSIILIKNVFQSIIQDNTMLLENLVQTIYLDVTIKKLRIELKHLDGYLEPIKTLLIQSKCHLNSCLKTFEKNLKSKFFITNDHDDIDELTLKKFNITSTEIFLKINTVYDYVHNIWIRKISYYKTLVHAYLLMDYVNFNNQLIDQRNIDTFFINMRNLSRIKNQICDNYDYLVQAFEKTGIFFMSIFETNHLNTIPYFSQLFSERLSILMNYYKSRIEKINKISETEKDITCFKKKLYYES